MFICLTVYFYTLNNEIFAFEACFLLGLWKYEAL